MWWHDTTRTVVATPGQLIRWAAALLTCHLLVTCHQDLMVSIAVPAFLPSRSYTASNNDRSSRKNKDHRSAIRTLAGADVDEQRQLSRSHNDATGCFGSSLRAREPGSNGTVALSDGDSRARTWFCRACMGRNSTGPLPRLSRAAGQLGVISGPQERRGTEAEADGLRLGSDWPVSFFFSRRRLLFSVQPAISQHLNKESATLS
jgi:hypothetical protein